MSADDSKTAIINSAGNRCLLCDGAIDEGCGDSWIGLCPACADRVSKHMDHEKLSDESGDLVINRLKLMSR